MRFFGKEPINNSYGFDPKADNIILIVELSVKSWALQMVSEPMVRQEELIEYMYIITLVNILYS